MKQIKELVESGFSEKSTEEGLQTEGFSESVETPFKSPELGGFHTPQRTL